MITWVVIGLIIVWLGPLVFWIGVVALLELVGRRAREREERERMARKGLQPLSSPPPSVQQVSGGAESPRVDTRKSLDEVISRINARERKTRASDRGAAFPQDGLADDVTEISDGVTAGGGAMLGTAVGEQMLRIVRCPHVAAWWERPGAANPCAKILAYQRDSGVATSFSKTQVPEPWSGRLEQAPILFIGSAPGLAADELYPGPYWADVDTVEFFTHRFSRYVLGGTRYRRQDQAFSEQWTRYWAAVKQRADEVLVREPQPGEDYALTEVVHCKTSSEDGVWEVRDECIDRYFSAILEMSAAKLIVCLGNHARDALYRVYRQDFESWPDIPSCTGPIELAGRMRRAAFLPHPNARQSRSFARCLPDDIESLQQFLRQD